MPPTNPSTLDASPQSNHSSSKQTERGRKTGVVNKKTLLKQQQAEAARARFSKGKKDPTKPEKSILEGKPQAKKRKIIATSPSPAGIPDVTNGLGSIKKTDSTSQGNEEPSDPKATASVAEVAALPSEVARLTHLLAQNEIVLQGLLVRVSAVEAELASIRTRSSHTPVLE